MTTTSTMPAPRTKSKFTCQSESRDAQRCHLRWFARWPLALQTGDENPPQRIGSIGHAVLSSDALWSISPSAHAVDMDLARRDSAVTEAHRRGWFARDTDEPDWFKGEYQRGLAGACLIDANVARGTPVRLPDGTPLIEHRLKVTWDRLMAIVPPSMFAAFDRIATALARLGRLGIEGQPDIAHRLHGYAFEHLGADVLDGSTLVYLDDYKFRQKPNLGGALGKADLTTIDPQGAFYSVLLRASGAIGLDEPVAFRQINAYAGRWLTVDDFVDERQRVQASGARGTLTLDSGLPSRDVERMGAMVTPEVWAEAHRVLANLRHDDRRAQHEVRLHHHRQAVADYATFKAENPKSRKQPPREPSPPDRLTATEEADARAFVADLAVRPLYQVQTCSLDPGACLELVRDMLAAVLSAENEHASGLPPARTFDPHPRGPCVRPYGCDLLSPCKASLGSGNAVATLQDFAERANLRRSLTVLPSGVGDDPADAATAPRAVDAEDVA